MPIAKRNSPAGGSSAKKSTISVVGPTGPTDPGPTGPIDKPTVLDRYQTIGEAAKLCEVKPHVLRYWEQEFEQLKPTKRRGNRRYYQAKDLDTVRLIRTLLHDQGFTIEGARKQLASKGKRVHAKVSSDSSNDRYKQVVKETIADLQSILNIHS